MNLKELEARLQSLIEVRLVSALPGQKAEDRVVQRLTEAMGAGAVPGAGGQLVAPNVYTLLARPETVARWRNAELLDILIQILKTTAQQNDLRFDVSPSISVAEDATIAAGEFRWIASFRAQPLAETKDMKTDTAGDSNEGQDDIIPENAFVIVEGVKVFQLTEPVVNIGRRLDNTLVVDDPRVSRTHAQLRAIKGRFVLFDLNSTGGTFVNGQRTNQTVLYPGDVISLAGVSLIFGQDNSMSRSDLSRTSPHSDAGADRSTAVIHSRSLPPTPKKKGK